MVSLRRLGAVGLVLAVVLGGTAAALGVIGTPAVESVENKVVAVNASSTVIATDIAIRNPNPIPIALGGLDVNYTVSLGGVDLATGRKDGVSVPTGNSTVRLVTVLDNERIPPWWVSHVRNDEHSTLRVRVTVSTGFPAGDVSVTPVERPVTTDILSAFASEETRPVNAGLPVVRDPVLYVNETSAAWGPVTATETPIDMRFVVYNPKTVPYTITEIGYSITMNGIPVGDGATRREHLVEPHDTETIEARTVIRNQRLDEWWASHVARGEETTLRIEFYARIEVAGETVRVRLDALTYTETIETDIFESTPADGTRSAPEDGDGTGAAQPGTGGSPSPGDGADGGTTADSTPTPTPSIVPSVPNGTETDDGLV